MKRTTVSERALVLAPRGRDAAIATAMLREAEIAAEACASLPELIRGMDMGAGLVVVTEEAFATADLAPLAAWIADQQEWSDMPFVLLTSQGGGLERNPAARRFLDVLGNVTFLERPFHPTTLVSLAKAALRGRRRQYDARARIETLHESEARFRNMADHAPVMMWVTDSDGACTYLNRAWHEFTGQTPQDAEGFGWLEATHPDDKARAERVFLGANARRQPFRLEYRLRRADGAFRWSIDAASPRFGPRGTFLGYVGSVLDIDDRREAETRLRESEERLRLATEAAEVGFWDLDLAADVLVWPPRVKAMFGIPPGEPVTMADFYAGLDPEDRERTIEAFAAAADPGRRALYDVEYRTVGRVDGVVRWVAAKGRGLFDASGVCVRVLGTAIDVTERKRVEAELRDLNDNLERRVVAEVAERARAEEQLRQSQKMEAMGQLTGGVAHDFNNLLTPIIGSLDRLITRGIGTERERRLMAGALESAERAKTLVQRLLAFARRQPLQPVPVDVGRVVEGMVDLLRSTLGPTIELQVSVDAELPPARADANQLEMALLNLAVNARDAMPEGGRLTLATSRESVRRPEGHGADGHGSSGHRANGGAPGGAAGGRSGLKAGHYVRLAVIDTGTGMDASTLAHAVEPFFSTKGIGKGTGLGLSMVHGLAAQLGGTLTIRSALGEGTTVELWLPLSDRPVERAGAKGEARPVVVQKGRALLVDDEDLVRMSTADMLSDLGFEVREAGSAEEALRLLRDGEVVDLLITDHLMPGMSGIDLAREARSLHRGLPVLIVSGYAEAEDLAPDLPRLVKPFRVADLAEHLTAILST